jgi:NhaP-type Na+/H+ and K+/H+ antiporter
MTGHAGRLAVKRLAAIGVLLAIEIFVRFEPWIFGVTELSGFLVGCRIAGVRAVTAQGM